MTPAQLDAMQAQAQARVEVWRTEQANNRNQDRATR